MSDVRYRISIDGDDATSNFDPVLIALTITDKDGGKSDTLELELDDSYGQLLLPRTGALITAALWPAGQAPLVFSGYTDEPHSHGARGAGMLLALTAQSANPKGKNKAPQRRHRDKASFGSIAQEWGAACGYQIMVDQGLAAIERDYWSIDESFDAWGTRIARELGATYKVSGARAVFVPRGSANSASGAALGAVEAVRPGNVVDWDMTPIRDRTLYQAFTARWYDPVAAQWRDESVSDSSDDGSSAVLSDRFKRGSKDRASQRAQSNKAEADREKGGGTITIDGNTSALSQATCLARGLRDGIDGAYRIVTADHRLERQSGYLTGMHLAEPGGAAGSDTRKAPAPAQIPTPDSSLGG